MCVIWNQLSPDHRELATLSNKLSVSVLGDLLELDRLSSGTCTWTLASASDLKVEYCKFPYRDGRD